MRLALTPAAVKALLTALARWSPKCQVVVGGPAFVAVSFDRETHIGMLAEELRVGLHRRLLVAPEVGLVIVEINILDALAEQVFVRHI